jgi:hypothetical protein
MPFEQTRAYKPSAWWLSSRALPKLVLWLSIVGIGLAGCKHYQYATVSGDLNLDESNKFIYENDIVRVKYWFKGLNGPIQIEVFNKLNKSIYADWGKSAMIQDEKRFAYWEDISILKTGTIGATVNVINGVTVGTGRTRGTLLRSERISFIPPQSAVTVSPLKLKATFFDHAIPTKADQIKLGSEKAYAFDYTPENSPLKFRSYLTLSITEDFKEPVIFDNKFWVSKIIETLATPGYSSTNAPNQFHVSKRY